MGASESQPLITVREYARKSLDSNIKLCSYQECYRLATYGINPDVAIICGKPIELVELVDRSRLSLPTFAIQRCNKHSKSKNSISIDCSFKLEMLIYIIRSKIILQCHVQRYLADREYILTLPTNQKSQDHREPLSCYESDQDDDTVDSNAGKDDYVTVVLSNIVSQWPVEIARLVRSYLGSFLILTQEVIDGEIKGKYFVEDEQLQIWQLIGLDSITDIEPHWLYANAWIPADGYPSGTRNKPDPSVMIKVTNVNYLDAAHSFHIYGKKVWYYTHYI